MLHEMSDALRQELMRCGDRIEPIRHAEALVASSYLVFKGGRPLAVCKIHRRAEDFHRESFFLSRLRSILPVPQLLEAIEPEQALLLEWCPGSLLIPAEVSPPLAGELGLVLAQLHEQREPLFGDPVAPAEQSESPWPGMARKFLEELDECRLFMNSKEINACSNLFERGYASVRPIPNRARTEKLLQLVRAVGVCGRSLWIHGQNRKSPGRWSAGLRTQPRSSQAFAERLIQAVD